MVAATRTPHTARMHVIFVIVVERRDVASIKVIVVIIFTIVMVAHDAVHQPAV
jgi:hypothetical protein